MSYDSAIDSILDWMMRFVMLPLLILVVLTIVIGVVAVAYSAMNPSPTFELKKDHWECTDAIRYKTTCGVKIHYECTQTACINYHTKVAP